MCCFLFCGVHLCLQGRAETMHTCACPPKTIDSLLLIFTNFVADVLTMYSTYTHTCGACKHPHTLEHTVDMICKQSPSIASVTAIRFCLPVFTETFSFRKDHCFCCCLLEIQSSNLFISLLKVSASMHFCSGLFSILPRKSLLSNKIK